MVNPENVVVPTAETPASPVRDPLLDVPTSKLVEELSRRPGCFYLAVEPHGRGSVGIDGPATCIVVLD